MKLFVRFLYALEMLLQEHHGIQGEDIMMMRSEEYLETCINEYISLYDTHHRLMKILLFRAQGSSLECFRVELYRPFNRISQSLVYGDAEKVPDDKYSYSRFYNPFAYCMDVYYV